jgi:hypothetical protein
MSTIPISPLGKALYDANMARGRQKTLEREARERAYAPVAAANAAVSAAKAAMADALTGADWRLRGPAKQALADARQAAALALATYNGRER